MIWTVEPGQSVTKWAVSGCRETAFAGVAATQPDIDYRFLNGTGRVGDLPCRVAFRKTMIGRAMTCPDDWLTEELRLADDTPRVDYSGFWHRPTHVRRLARCTLTADAATAARFRVATCGGVVIWVNGMEAARFEPFERNRRQTTEIDLPLAAGDNAVTAHFEDLSERDTNWHFELTLVSETPLGVGLPVAAGGEQLEGVRRTLEGLRLNRLFFGDEPVELICEPAWAQATTLDVVVAGGHGDKAPAAMATVDVAAGQGRCVVLAGRDAPPGCAVVTVRARVGDAFAERVLGATFLGRIAAGTGSTIEDRRREVARALIGSRRGGAAKALLHLELGVDLSIGQQLIDRELVSAELRDDCSDFDMVPVLWAWHSYRDKYFDAGFWRRAREVILGYRYWLDEPGNDVMWFWSENHVLCFHASQYLAGQMFPDEVFAVSGRTGAEQQRIASERLRRWFAAVEMHGFVEWNSAAYYPIDFIGLVALHALAADDDIRALAARQMDRLFVMIALHTLNGVPTGSMGRAYEKELFAASSTELATCAHIAWGRGWIGAGVKSVPMMCLSDYVPPALTAGYARPEGVIAAAYSQGLGHDGQLVLWKDADAQMSTVNGHQPAMRGHQQHVVDVQLAGDPRARFWVNRPGDHRAWGSLRPSHWAGNATLPNVAQVDDMALLVFGPAAAGTEDLPTYTHAFVPAEACDEVNGAGNWVFARSGDGYVGLFASGGLEPTGAGLYAGSAWRCEAAVSGWLVVVGSRRRHRSFGDFCRAWRASEPSFDAAAVRLTVARDGREFGLAVDGTLVIDGEAMAFRHLQSTPVVAVGGEDLGAWVRLAEAT